MLTRFLLDEWRFLTFRGLSPDLRTHAHTYLGFALFFTWFAGIGRYWDNPRAELWQLLGLGSLVYVLVLALVLSLITWPLRPRRWSYRNVLLFVALTSLPAILYAIPVEQFMSAHAARTANVWFLAIVASWRVALLAHFLRTVAVLAWARVVVATLLPLVAIVSALSALNPDHVVFRIMGGLRDSERSSNDGAYVVVLVLTYLSIWALPVLLVAYGVMVSRARGEARTETAREQGG